MYIFDSQIVWTVAVVCIAITQASPLRHNPGAPEHVSVPTIPPYSLSSACASETRELCEVRSPYGDRAIQCFESHRAELSPQCLDWHDARLACKNQVEASTFEECPECKSFCGAGKSLMHCIRAAGHRIHSLGIDRRCSDTAFFRSIQKPRRGAAKIA